MFAFTSPNPYNLAYENSQAVFTDRLSGGARRGCVGTVHSSGRAPLHPAGKLRRSSSPVGTL